jgi:hypothetical protein
LWQFTQLAIHTEKDQPVIWRKGNERTARPKETTLTAYFKLNRRYVVDRLLNWVPPSQDQQQPAAASPASQAAPATPVASQAVDFFSTPRGTPARALVTTPAGSGDSSPVVVHVGRQALPDAHSGVSSGSYNFSDLFASDSSAQASPGDPAPEPPLSHRATPPAPPTAPAPFSPIDSLFDSPILPSTHHQRSQQPMDAGHQSDASLGGNNAPADPQEDVEDEDDDDEEWDDDEDAEDDGYDGAARRRGPRLEDELEANEVNSKLAKKLKDLIYIDVPEWCTFNFLDRKWMPKLRKTKEVYGFIRHVDPKHSETFHLKMMLGHVKAPKSFEDVRTVNGVVHETYREACFAMGLLRDDREFER